MAFNY